MKRYKPHFKESKFYPPDQNWGHHDKDKENGFHSSMTLKQVQDEIESAIFNAASTMFYNRDSVQKVIEGVMDVTERFPFFIEDFNKMFKKNIKTNQQLKKEIEKMIIKKSTTAFRKH